MSNPIIVATDAYTWCSVLPSHSCSHFLIQYALAGQIQETTPHHSEVHTCTSQKLKWELLTWYERNKTLFVSSQFYFHFSLSLENLLYLCTFSFKAPPPSIAHIPDVCLFVSCFEHAGLLWVFCVWEYLIRTTSVQPFPYWVTDSQERETDRGAQRVQTNDSGLIMVPFWVITTYKGV